jgi:hypothetical protein
MSETWCVLMRSRALRPTPKGARYKTQCTDDGKAASVLTPQNGGFYWFGCPELKGTAEGALSAIRGSP